MVEKPVIPPEELAQPFYLLGSNDPLGQQRAYERYFVSRKDVLASFARLGYRYKWVAELGYYVDQAGQLQWDWIYFVWSANDHYGPLPPLYNGRPEGDELSIVPYTPAVA